MSYVIPDFQSKADDAFTRTHESCVLFYPDSPAIVSIFCQMFWIFSDRLMGRFRSFTACADPGDTSKSKTFCQKLSMQGPMGNGVCQLSKEDESCGELHLWAALCCVVVVTSPRAQVAADFVRSVGWWLEPRAGKTLILSVMDVTSGGRLG